MQHRGGKPLFLYYAVLEPHMSWLRTEEFIGKSRAGSYGDYIVQLDYEVGRVLAALKKYAGDFLQRQRSDVAVAGHGEIQP